MRAPYSNYIARLSVASFGVIPFVDQRTVLPTLGGLLFEISEVVEVDFYYIGPHHRGYREVHFCPT